MMLDFSDIIADPDMAETDAFTITQTTRSLSTGVPVDTRKTIGTFTGPVIPGGSSVLREADGSHVAGAITVYSPVSLSSGSRVNDLTHHLADLVTWHGDVYVVKSASDWSRMNDPVGGFSPGEASVGSSGFWVAECELLTLSAAS